MMRLANLWFWLRTRRQAKELELALTLRRRNRAARQAAARRGVNTRFQNRMEGLTR